MPKVGMYESDAYTAGTMRRMKELESNENGMAQGPNSTPAGALQKRTPNMATGMDHGATPNSTPQGSLQKGTQARGQPMIGYPGEIPQVMDYGGIPHRPDPNMGGASQLTKKGTGTGY